MDNINTLSDLKVWYGTPIISKLNLVVTVCIFLWTLKDIFMLKCPVKYIPLDLMLRLIPMLCWIPLCICRNHTTYIWWSFTMMCCFCLGQLLVLNNIPIGKAIIADGFYMWMFVFVFYGMCLPNRLPVYIFFGIYSILFFFSDAKLCASWGIPKTFLWGGVNFLASSRRHLVTFIILMFSSITMINVQGNLYKILWEEKQAVEYNANHDYLSGLYNRSILTKIIQNDTYHDNSYFVFIDIDNFKMFNDQYGHDVGDQVILRVADKLKETFDEGENYILRQGGDEFFCIIDVHTNIEEKLNYIYDTINKDQELTIGLSIGYADYIAGTSVERTKKTADDALYVAKDKGKNKYIKG